MQQKQLSQLSQDTAVVLHCLGMSHNNLISQQGQMQAAAGTRLPLDERAGCWSC